MTTPDARFRARCLGDHGLQVYLDSIAILPRGIPASEPLRPMDYLRVRSAGGNPLPPEATFPMIEEEHHTAWFNLEGSLQHVPRRS